MKYYMHVLTMFDHRRTHLWWKTTQHDNVMASQWIIWHCFYMAAMTVPKRPTLFFVLFNVHPVCKSQHPNKFFRISTPGITVRSLNYSHIFGTRSSWRGWWTCAEISYAGCRRIFDFVFPWKRLFKQILYWFSHKIRKIQATHLATFDAAFNHALSSQTIWLFVKVSSDTILLLDLMCEKVTTNVLPILWPTDAVVIIVDQHVQFLNSSQKKSTYIFTIRKELIRKETIVARQGMRTTYGNQSKINEEFFRCVQCTRNFFSFCYCQLPRLNLNGEEALN